MPKFERPKPNHLGTPRMPEPREREPSKPLEKKGIDEELSINDLHINEEIMGQALLMRKYTKELSRIRRKTKGIKNKLELEEGKLHIQFSNDGKGRTVAEVKAAVIQNTEIQKLRIELYDAEELEDEYEGVVRAIAHRMDMLKDLCANLRKEMIS